MKNIKFYFSSTKLLFYKFKFSNQACKASFVGNPAAVYVPLTFRSQIQDKPFLPNDIHHLFKSLSVPLKKSY